MQMHFSFDFKIWNFWLIYSLNPTRQKYKYTQVNLDCYIEKENYRDTKQN